MELQDAVGKGGREFFPLLAKAPTGTGCTRSSCFCAGDKFILEVCEPAFSKSGAVVLARAAQMTGRSSLAGLLAARFDG